LGAGDREIREAIAVAEVIAAGRVRSMVVDSSVKPQSDQIGDQDEGPAADR